MKTLLIMRHAKSSWADESLSDFERPLNPRGLRDAPRMAKWLIAQDAVPDWIVSSSANRAKATATLVAQECERTESLRFNESFYMGRTNDYIDILNLISVSNDRVMVVGHNPGIASMVLRFTGVSERMPTAAVAVIRFEIVSWDALTVNSPGTLEHVWRPKEIDD